MEIKQIKIECGECGYEDLVDVGIPKYCDRCDKELMHFSHGENGTLILKDYPNE